MNDLADAELVEEYVTHCSQEAFELLAERHGGIVFSTCSRLLGNREDAEDAAQTVFLLLARKAGSLFKREAVAGWLFRTAHLVCQNRKRVSIRRRKHEKEVTTMRQLQSNQKYTWNEVRPELDSALVALPRKYRDAIALAYLEGRTQAEVARELNIPKGTVKSRLSKGLSLLRERLVRKDVSVTSAVLGSLLLKNRAEAVPVPLAAKLSAAGAVAAGSVSSAGISSASYTITRTSPAHR